jgi:predicted Ser/Thr protein kinase
MLRTGDVLQNRYRVEGQLGRGGMGAVYAATDLRLSRAVALKETLAETDELRRAFEREARLLANLRHPSLPKVLDHFEEGEGLFLVMEFIPGEDLGAMIEREARPFPVAEVMRWADELLGALEYLHTLDPPVLHRDIKPANLKLISRQQVVLLDFGLAKGSAGQMTRAGSRSVLAYSPNYSPLEQIQGAGTDERSDLYSLAATLYHLLTAVKPADAITRAAAHVGGHRDPLRPARQLNPEVSPSVSAALMHALALDIERRPRTAADLRRELHASPARAAATVPIEGAGERDIEGASELAVGADELSVKDGGEFEEAGGLNAEAGGGLTADEAEDLTRVAPRGVRRGAVASPVARAPVRGPQVVVSLPEETQLARRRGGSKWLAVLGVVFALALLSAVLYLLLPGTNTQRRAQTNQPRARSTPRPTPAETPAENINQQSNINANDNANLNANAAAPPDNLNSQPAGPEELAARARLADKEIPYTESAFARAVEDGDTGAVDLFLAAGMRPDAADSSGRTPLISAAANGHDQISRKLLTRGADVNARDRDGSTPLMQSAQGDHKETTRVLLEAGADVNARDADGQTALMRAASRGHTEIVRMLLDRGARVDVRDKTGRDALAWAEINDKRDVVDLLKKAGAAKP